MESTWKISRIGSFSRRSSATVWSLNCLSPTWILYKLVFSHSVCGRAPSRENFEGDAGVRQRVDQPRAQAWAALHFDSMNHKPRQIARNLSKEQIHPLISQQTVNRCFRKQEEEKRGGRRRRSGRQGWLIQCYFHSHFSSHWICLPVFLAIDFQLNEPATPSTQHAHVSQPLRTTTDQCGIFHGCNRVRTHTKKSKKWCKHKNAEAKKPKKTKQKNN